MGSLERDLWSSRQGWPSGPVVGSENWRDRPLSRRALEEVRSANGSGAELEDSRTKAEGQDQHLGGRGGQLLPEQCCSPAGSVSIEGRSALWGQDRLWAGQRALLAGTERARTHERDGCGD